MRADQCPLSLGKVVFNDKIGTVIKGHQQIVAYALGNDAFWTDTGCLFGELVVHAIYCLNMQRTACSIDVVLSDGVTGVVFQGQGDLLCHS